MHLYCGLASIVAEIIVHAAKGGKKLAVPLICEIISHNNYEHGKLGGIHMSVAANNCVIGLKAHQHVENYFWF